MRAPKSLLNFIFQVFQQFSNIEPALDVGFEVFFHYLLFLVLDDVLAAEADAAAAAGDVDEKRQNGCDYLRGHELFVDLNPRTCRRVHTINAGVLHRVERAVRPKNVARFAEFRFAELSPDAGRGVCCVNSTA